MPNKYKRPEETYNTTTSTSYSNRFQDKAQQKVPLMGADLDREYNALIDNDNDLDKRLNEFVADVFPGSSAAENADKVVYSDGTRAQFSKVLERFIDSNAISTAKLQNASVTNAKMANGAISTSKLVDGSVTGVKLAAQNVENRHLMDGVITTAKIANSAITTEKISDRSVTMAKFADGSFDTSKIADKSLTPKKTQGCFFIGEIKYSAFEASGEELFFGLRNGWIPISVASRIPAACFPELEKRIKGTDTLHNNQYLVKIVEKLLYSKRATYGIDCFDFSLLLGSFPMLVGHSMPFGTIIDGIPIYAVLGDKGYVEFLSKIEEAYPSNLAEILKDDNFNKYHIPNATVRGYANASIAAASAEGTLNDLPGSKRRFGENSITIGLENMPAHTHNYTKTTKAASTVAIGNNHDHEQYYFNVTESILGTTSTGGGKELPHLPPSFPVFGYMFGGSYDKTGWPEGGV